MPDIKRVRPSLNYDMLPSDSWTAASIESQRKMQTSMKCVLCGVMFAWAASAELHAAEWYKGQTHAHTMWSGKYGDPNWNGAQCLPEIAAHWYKTHGYHFVAFTDYCYTTSGEEVLWRGDKWSKPLSFYSWYDLPGCVRDAEALFGPGWNATKGSGPEMQVKLKKFDEVGAKLNEPGRFLLIPGAEISCPGVTVSTNPPRGAAVHISAVNLAEIVIPVKGSPWTVAATINDNVALINRQAQRLNRPMLAILNHPNAYWGDMSYAISPEDIAQAKGTNFFEMANCSARSRHYGDASHPSEEKMWDIANAIRLGSMDGQVVYGVASDDAHEYPPYTAPSPDKLPPGRGYIVVRAQELSADAILAAISRGDFYASTGVTLSKLDYDPATGTLAVEVAPSQGVSYRIDFIGTMRGVNPKRNADGTYSEEIGKVLKSVDGVSASYTFSGKELYVRAYVHSDKLMDSPPVEGVQNQCAWTQPIDGRKKQRDKRK